MTDETEASAPAAGADEALWNQLAAERSGKATEELAASTAAETTEDDAKDTGTPPAEQADPEDIWATAPEPLRNAYRSLEDKYQKDHRQIAGQRRKIAELMRSAPAAQPPADAADIDEALNEMSDYPDLAGPVGRPSNAASPHFPECRSTTVRPRSATSRRSQAGPYHPPRRVRAHRQRAYHAGNHPALQSKARPAAELALPRPPTGRWGRAGQFGRRTLAAHGRCPGRARGRRRRISRPSSGSAAAPPATTAISTTTATAGTRAACVRPRPGTAGNVPRRRSADPSPDRNPPYAGRARAVPRAPRDTSMNRRDPPGGGRRRPPVGRWLGLALAVLAATAGASERAAAAAGTGSAGSPGSVGRSRRRAGALRHARRRPGDPGGARRRSPRATCAAAAAALDALVAQHPEVGAVYANRATLAMLQGDRDGRARPARARRRPRLRRLPAAGGRSAVRAAEGRPAARRPRRRRAGRDPCPGRRRHGDGRRRQYRLGPGDRAARAALRLSGEAHGRRAAVGQGAGGAEYPGRALEARPRRRQPRRSLRQPRPRALAARSGGASAARLRQPIPTPPAPPASTTG